MQLKDKVAIVTGSGRGIGAGIAHALASEGAILIVIDRNMADAQAVARKIESAGGQAMAVEADVTKKATLDAMVAAVLQKYGSDRHPRQQRRHRSRCPCCSRTSPRRNGTATLSVNLKGVFLCCQAVIPQMTKQNSGRIINIGSLAGRRMSFFGSADYTVSK